MAVVGRFEACQLNACVAWAPERRGTGASWPVGKGPEASGHEPSPISSLAAVRLIVQNRASDAAPRHQTSGARLPTFEPTCPNPNFRRACHFFAAEHDAMIPHFLIGAPPLDSCRRSGCTWQWMAAAVRAAPPSVAGVSSTAHMFPAPPPIAAPSHAFCERADSNLLLSCWRASSVGQRLPW